MVLNNSRELFRYKTRRQNLNVDYEPAKATWQGMMMKTIHTIEELSPVKRYNVVKRIEKEVDLRGN